MRILNRPLLLLLSGALLGGCVTADADRTDDDVNDDELGDPPDGPVIVGGDRPVEVYVPAGYDHAEATPLLISLHGYGASAEGVAAYLGLEDQADDFGLLLLAPSGTRDSSGEGFWNASDACCDFERSGVDDSGYIADLIEEVGDQLHLDDDQVFIIGHSNGGFMAYRMACEHSDLLAGVVSIAGAMPSREADCDPDEALAALQIHGTADTTVLYRGGSFGAIRYPGAVETTEKWAALAGCATTGEDAAAAMDHQSNLAGPDTLATTYSDGCDEGGHAELWTVDGMAHTPVPNGAFVPAILEFLLDHPKP
jgi:polyhydroxybutyrate depolymerase